MLSMDIYKNSEADLLDVLKRVIFNCENNSTLIIGPRGSGKTFLIKRVFEKLFAELRERDCTEDDLLIVHLSGCLQADDKSALWEISRQLKLENVINDKVFGSFADSFEFLLKSMKAGNQQSKPLIFILDEFDLFTKNKTQLLLYTILNTIQTASTPMCLIGCTSRIDVLDLLEKRIKSRFSHRQIYLFKEFDKEKYVDIAKYFIQCDYYEQNGELISSGKERSAFARYLTEYLNHAFNDPQVIYVMKQMYQIDKSLATLKRLIMLPALRLGDLTKEQLVAKETELFKKELRDSFDMVNMDTKTNLLNGLSILELTLVICMLLLSESFVGEPFNFELIYTAYLRFMNKANSNQQKYERQVILKAYEHLIKLKCVLPATEYLTHNKMAKINKEYALMYLALDRDEIDICLAKYPNCPTELRYYRTV